MEMWKMLTQKFKAQSLDEGRPFQGQEVEERDSGTESDEENAELQAIEEAMHIINKDQENNQPAAMLSRSGYQSPATSPISSFTTIKRPFQLVTNNHQHVSASSGGGGIPFQPLSTNTSQQYYRRAMDSPQGSAGSDFERCSLDYDDTLSSLDFDMAPPGRHSSEEELAIINCSGNGSGNGTVTKQAEKRKWSQMQGGGACSNGSAMIGVRCGSCNDSSGSSDDEVRDLLGQPKPLNFSSSPPKGVQRLSQATLSPKLFLANLSPSNVRLCSVSPRKRHRQGELTDSTVIQRPCLDFEKMQKTLFRKHIPHGIAKARFVKIRLGLIKGPV